MAAKGLFASIGLGSGVLLVATGVASDVDTAVTEEDAAAVAGLHLDPLWGETPSFEAEVVCVQALRARLAAEAPDLTCVHEWGAVSHEPAAFLSRRVGCCYDRSRTIEKALAHYGFAVRHLAVHATRRYPAPLNYVAPGVQSHSISEVETSQGWMVVDSNAAWVAVSDEGRPLDARALRTALRDGEDVHGVPDGYFGGRYTIAYGLYSRHGGFYPPFVGVPDVDWDQLHHNLGTLF